MSALGKEETNRDLGLPDKYETWQLNRLLHREGSTSAEKLLCHIHRLVRRDQASLTILEGLKKMSPGKQAAMLVLAFKTLDPVDWAAFKKQLESVKDKNVRLCRLKLKLPFAHLKNARAAYVDTLRTTF